MSRPVSQFTAILFAFTISCQSLSTTPDKDLVFKFDSVDRLSVHRLTADPRTGSVSVEDPKVIERLRQIYLSAQWKPFIDTMPADTMTIHAYSDRVESFRLAFGAGWLMEWSDDGPVRKGILNEQDRSWLHTFVTTEVPLTEMMESDP